MQKPQPISQDANLDDALSAPHAVIAEILDGVLYHRPRLAEVDVEHLWHRLAHTLFMRRSTSITEQVEEAVCQPVLELGASVLRPEGGVLA